MKKNILVFPCGSEIALDIYQSVKYSTYFNLIGASSVDDHGQYVYKDYIGNVPFSDDPRFLPAIKDIISSRKIDAIYPAMDSVIALLKDHENELGCPVIASPAETAAICASKKLTYTRLSSVIRTPRIFSPDDIPEYPCFIKPDIGYGSRGAIKISNPEQARFYLTGKADLICTEYLPGEEYTVDCFTDRNNVLLYCAARLRNRVKCGISVNTSFVTDQKEFEVIANAIKSELTFRGAWFFQVKRDKNGELCLLEIASRLGGSSLLSNARGANLALMTLFDAFNYNLAVHLNDYSVEMDRAFSQKFKVDICYSNVYVDYDDCLVLNKSHVNEELIGFLYQCINNNKKIILLSKHAGDLEQQLRHLRLSTLFDKVIHIKEGEEKSSYIKEKSSIFIDDSFTEREKVHHSLGIPVFSPEMICTLAQW